MVQVSRLPFDCQAIFLPPPARACAKSRTMRRSSTWTSATS